MRTTITFLALSYMAVCVQAQSLTRADLPQIGDSQYYTACDTTGVTTGASGTGAVWDYSTLTPSGTNFTINYGAPTGHPQAGNYPAANFLESATNQQYRFMSASADSIVLEGEKSTANTAIIYDRKATLYTFPMSFGYLQIDSVHGTYPDGFFSSVDRLGQYTVEVDASGSLTTPYATYPSVLRLKTEGAFFDSSWTGAADAQVSTRRYEWYATGTTKPVMVMTFTRIVINGGNPQIGRDVWYADVPSSIDNGGLKHQLTMAPNQVSGPVTVTYTLDAVSETRLSVMDVTGRAVRELGSSMEVAGTHSHELDLGGLKPGMYFLRLQTPQGEESTKFVVH